MGHSSRTFGIGWRPCEARQNRQASDLENPRSDECRWCLDQILLFPDDEDWVHGKTLWPACTSDFQTVKPEIRYATPNNYEIQEDAL